MLQIFFKMNALNFMKDFLSHSFVLVVPDSTALKSLIKMKLF